MNDRVWQAKLAAWTHDPAEKALVLLRDPAGHEGGTVRALREILFHGGLPDGVGTLVKRADHWAAAADRPQWPQVQGMPWLDQVRFYRHPVLIHPLSGKPFELKGRLDEVEVEAIKEASFGQFEALIDPDRDPRRTALAFWRFGPERAPEGLGALWGRLPADTRVPDHSIWSHLDLTAAFATAMAADPRGVPALLVVSLGPVQGFIAQARSTSDLWAGSHLLSRMAWEGIKVVASDLGPDQLLFPQLRGIAEVDVWLRDEVELSPDWFAEQPWASMRSDANPLFSAALPNRFVAIVPAGEAEKIARRIEGAVRDWVQEQGRETLRRLLKAAGVEGEEDLPCHAQLETQLAGFPEVHWAVVPWSLATGGAGDVDTTGVEALLRRLYPEGEGAPGFLGSAAWQVLAKPIDLGGSRFFEPNPGVLYPALYDALDRLAAAAKVARPFDQLPQEGFRCTLCGEREWLTGDRDHLSLTKGQRGRGAGRTETLWTWIAKNKPAWARRGDHLCGLCALKRVWPEMVRERVEEVLPDGSYSERFVLSTHTMAITRGEMVFPDVSVERFVLSTHTMAMAPDLEALRTVEEEKLAKLRQTPTYQQASSQRPAALPKRIYDRLTRDGDEERRRFLQGLPTYLDALRDGLDSDDAEQQRQYQEALSRVAGDLRGALGRTPETYYAVVVMDGDHMGAWLAGNDERYRIAYGESWHPQVRSHAKELAVGNERLARYLEAKRPPSPGRHMAISAALNGFAVELARPIVEDLYKGKLLYAGGDDVLALVAVDDVVEVATLLRLAYGGVLPGGGKDAFWAERFADASRRYRIGGGFVLDGGDRRDKRPRRLYQVMGERATASCGIVIAHYMTSLARVLKEARAAEQRAKGAGRDRLAITVMKRAGGAIPLTVPWGLDNAASLAEIPAGLLLALRDHLAHPNVSRRTAYHVYDWIRQLPTRAHMEQESQRQPYEALIEKSLAYQFHRQAQGAAQEQARDLAGRLAAFSRHQAEEPAALIEAFLGVAEFLARRGRARQEALPKEEVPTHG